MRSCSRLKSGWSEAAARSTNAVARTTGSQFWKIAGAGAAFQGASSAVDSATIVASLVFYLTANVYAVGAASAVLRVGWLLPQVVVGYLAQKSSRRMPFYAVGAFGRATCIAAIALVLAFGTGLSTPVMGLTFLALWTIYAFVSGILAVPYNDIVARSIQADARSRLLAWRFFGGGTLAIGVAAMANQFLNSQPVLDAYAAIFALASVLMLISSFSFVSAGEPPVPRRSQRIWPDFRAFVGGGLMVLRTDARFRLFLCSQWLGGATLMALPFYVVAAVSTGLETTDVGVLLGAQAAGALASNAVWGVIGDRLGKLALLRAVGALRLVPPIGVLVIIAVAGSLTPLAVLTAFSALFFAIGAVVNGVTIGYLGFLMEISPDAERPAYSAYFNALASPAALLPLAGAAIADVTSLEAVFAVAVGAAAVQTYLYRALVKFEPAGSTS